MFNLISFAEVRRTTISQNSARRGGGAFNTTLSSLSITNSVVSGNKASQDGGGIFNTGAFEYFPYYYPAGHLSLVDSTISQNRAGNSGGGLFNEGSLNNANSTISGNRARFGPDIFP